jgi:hypothetical protein
MVTIIIAAVTVVLLVSLAIWAAPPLYREYRNWRM